MTAFDSLPLEMKCLLSGILFLAVSLQLALCLYEFVCHAKSSRLLDSALFVLTLLALSYVTAVSAGSREPIGMPWGIIPLTSAILTIRACEKMLRLFRQSRRQISLMSIKEALDDLNSAVAFADRDGRFVLINRTMNELTCHLLGSPPQVLDELMAALQSPAAHSGVVKTDGSQGLYRFSDGTIWRFHTNCLTEQGVEGFTEVTAQDVTDLFHANLGLEENNRALQDTNERIRQMLERLADRIREQETLRLKTRIHNEIGTSLIAISDLMNHGTAEDMDSQLRILENAVSYLTGDAASPNDSLDQLRQQAAQLKVQLHVEGRLPEKEPARTAAMAAVSECITNCVKHAQGDSVTVTAESTDECCTVTIVNSGRPPQNPITEGGGLSDLRRRVEGCGGRMRTEWTPRFQLTLHLPAKEDDQ